ncbi:hypothetical protein B0H63DRAFT_519203 [Podospora didyma]|uniref:Carboxylic ester hydrolase n=1 Tax=Podospora didyma TaxID=330526 RepID=A0AAE0NY82_9PEZI|nr:hypothetical protein B0H63DRAFT_519203 [Podospora didyma]
MLLDLYWPRQSHFLTSVQYQFSNKCQYNQHYHVTTQHIQGFGSPSVKNSPISPLGVSGFRFLGFPGTIVAIHGCDGPDENYFRNTPYASLAEEIGLVTILPLSFAYAGPCWDTSSNSSAEPGHGDPESIATMVSWASKHWHARSCRVAITGSSSKVLFQRIVDVYANYSGSNLIFCLRTGRKLMTYSRWNETIGNWGDPNFPHIDNVLKFPNSTTTGATKQINNTLMGVWVQGGAVQRIPSRG